MTNEQASAQYEAVATSHRSASDDDDGIASETPTQPNTTDSCKDQTNPPSDSGGPHENPAFTAENAD